MLVLNKELPPIFGNTKVGDKLDVFQNEIYTIENGFISKSLGTVHDCLKNGFVIQKEDLMPTPSEFAMDTMKGNHKTYIDAAEAGDYIQEYINLLHQKELI